MEEHTNMTQASYIWDIEEIACSCTSHQEKQLTKMSESFEDCLEND